MNKRARYKISIWPYGVGLLSDHSMFVVIIIAGPRVLN